MRLNAWRKQLSSNKGGSSLNEIDSDLMQALSEIPPMQLAKIDEAFVLLDSGLGAIFSAGMARRAAMQRSVTKTLNTPKINILSKFLGPTDEAGGAKGNKEKNLNTLRRATMRIVAPIRRQNAQRATLRMVSDLVGPKTLRADGQRSKGEKESSSRRGSFLTNPDAAEELAAEAEGKESKESDSKESKDLSKAQRRRSRKKNRTATPRKALDASMFMTAPAPVATIDFTDGGDDIAFSEECNVPPSCQLGEDPGFQLWAKDQLRIQPSRLRGLERTQHFRAKVGHQMLCWQALHVDKLAPQTESSISPMLINDEEHDLQGAFLCSQDTTDSTPRSSSWISVFSTPQSSRHHASMASTGGSTKESSAEYQVAAQSLFGLTRYLDAQMMRRSRTPTQVSPHHTEGGVDSIGRTSPESSPLPLRKAGASPTPLLERSGGALSAATQGHTAIKESNAWTITLGKRPRQSAVHSDVAPRVRLQVLDAESAADRPCSRDSTSSRRLPSRGQACEPPLGVALRRPPAFVEPHRDIPSTLISHTPELLYLRRCEVQGLIPCPAVWRKFGDSQNSVIDASKRGLSDADVCAIVETAVQCSADGHELHKLNLSHNAVTDVGAQRVARMILGPPMTCNMLTSLSLAGNAALKLRSDGLLKDLANLLTMLPALAELDMSGVPVHGHAASVLCHALQKSASLKSLSLAGCGLGRLDQTECTVVAGLLGYSENETSGRFGLESFDLSANFFGRMGFTAAAAALRRSLLKSLSFASNCAGVSAHNTHKDHAQFHPIQMLIEGLQFNTTITTLDLSDCSLGPDSSFILEDALQTHSTLTSLDLSENPLGDAGLRCLLRLILALGVDIHICTVCGHREADVSAHAVKFRYTQAGGGYRLNLKYPHERATLRTLLRISEKATHNPFRYFKFDAKQAKPNIEKDTETGKYVVPSHGIYSFSFQPPLSETALQYSQQARSAGAGVTATTVASQAAAAASAASALATHIAAKEEKQFRSKHLSSIFKGTSHEPNLAHRSSHRPSSVRASVATSGKDHVKFGPTEHHRPSSAAGMTSDAAAFEIDWTELTGLISTARLHVSALRYPLVRGMFLSLITKEQQSRFVLACSKDMAFNGPQVSQLCEDRPELALEIIGALFPSIRGRTAQLLLLSNVSAAFTPAACTEVSHCLWFQEGNLTGRYELDLEKPADYAVAENCLLVNAWESEVGRQMGRPDISQRGNFEMLRNESHNEVPFTFNREWSLPSHGWLKFDYSSIRRPPAKMSPMPEAGEVTRHLQRSDAPPSSKLRALRAVSVHLFLSSQQFKGLLQCFPAHICRQDFFCLLHTRVIDRQRLLSSECVYSNSHFSDEDREGLLHRVGHLQLLNPLHPEGMVFTCNLDNYEERKVIDYLVQLRSKEPGGRIIGQGIPHDEEKHGPVPASWADKGVPVEDLEIVCAYETTHPNPQWRQSLAEKYCVGIFSH